MLPFKVILFDLGNTLIYFDGNQQVIIAEGAQRLASNLVEAGYSLDKEKFASDFTNRLIDHASRRNQEYKEISSESVLRSLLEAHGHVSVPPVHLQNALNALHAAVNVHWHAEVDALSTLKSLEIQGSKLGIITNAGYPPNVFTLVDKVGLKPYFKKILTSAEVGFRKPHPFIFELALDYFQIRPKDAVVIGDSLAEDILGANNTGIASIWVTRRADTPENRANSLRIIPDHSVKNLSDLPFTLMNW